MTTVYLVQSDNDQLPLLGAYHPQVAEEIAASLMVRCETTATVLPVKIYTTFDEYERKRIAREAEAAIASLPIEQRAPIIAYLESLEGNLNELDLLV